MHLWRQEEEEEEGEEEEEEEAGCARRHVAGTVAEIHRSCGSVKFFLLWTTKQAVVGF